LIIIEKLIKEKM